LPNNIYTYTSTVYSFNSRDNVMWSFLNLVYMTVMIISNAEIWVDLIIVSIAYIINRLTG